MAKAIFILDRPDFQKMLTVLPPSEERDRLAERFRAAHDAYQAHQRRGPLLMAEMEAVGHDLVANPSDAKLATKAAALAAEMSLRPKTTEVAARAYADALTAWAAKTWRDFGDVHDQAVDAINALTPDWQRAVNRETRLQHGTPDYEMNRQVIERIREETAPHAEMRNICRRGSGAVEAALSMGIGAKPIHGRPQYGDVDRFVRNVTKAAA